MFTIKQVAENLGITPQAIYNQKEELQEKGFLSKNNMNDWEISSSGYNYLKDRQINRMKRKNNKFKDVEDESTGKTIKEDNLIYNETLTNFYENRIEEIKQSYESQLVEQKKQVEYFKSLYEEERSERQKVNAQYQTYLLGTAEDNEKASWWQFWKK